MRNASSLHWVGHRNKYILCSAAGWVVGGWWRYKKRAARKKCVIDRGGTTDHSEYSLER